MIGICAFHYQNQEYIHLDNEDQHYFEIKTIFMIWPFGIMVWRTVYIYNVPSLVVSILDGALLPFWFCDAMQYNYCLYRGNPRLAEPAKPPPSAYPAISTKASGGSRCGGGGCDGCGGCDG